MGFDSNIDQFGDKAMGSAADCGITKTIGIDQNGDIKREGHLEIQGTPIFSINSPTSSPVAA